MKAAILFVAVLKFNAPVHSPTAPSSNKHRPREVRTIDFKARNATKVCTVPPVTLEATHARLKTLLGV